MLRVKRRQICQFAYLGGAILVLFQRRQVGPGGQLRSIIFGLSEIQFQHRARVRLNGS